MNSLDAVKAATWPLHAQAERSGIVADIIAGQATPRGVGLFWRNLLPVYRVLDATSLCRPGLARSAALEADLLILGPSDVLPEARAYAERIERAELPALIGHAYVRYLGDLNGGRIMQKRLQVCLGPLAERLTFHLYPAIPDLAGFAADYRLQLDRLARSVAIEAVAAAATEAFALNIALSQAVHRLAIA